MVCVLCALSTILESRPWIVAAAALMPWYRALAWSPRARLWMVTAARVRVRCRAFRADRTCLA